MKTYFIVHTTAPNWREQTSIKADSHSIDDGDLSLIRDGGVIAHFTSASIVSWHFTEEDVDQVLRLEDL